MSLSSFGDALGATKAEIRHFQWLFRESKIIGRVFADPIPNSDIGFAERLFSDLLSKMVDGKQGGELFDVSILLIRRPVGAATEPKADDRQKLLASIADRKQASDDWLRPALQWVAARRDQSPVVCVQRRGAALGAGGVQTLHSAVVQCHKVSEIDAPFLLSLVALPTRREPRKRK